MVSKDLCIHDAERLAMLNITAVQGVSVPSMVLRTACAKLRAWVFMIIHAGIMDLA